MVALGLAAVDPIGIALTIIILTGKQPILRSLLFVLGSCLALLLMGFIFAHGIGAIVLATENHHHWLAPSFQILMGLLLWSFAAFSLRKHHDKDAQISPPKALLRYTNAGNVSLFFYGFLLVIIQSIIDVVFIVAMVRAGSLHPSIITLIIALIAYAAAAVSLQLLVVFAYVFSPAKRRKQVLQTSRKILNQYGEKTVILLGFILGAFLIINSLLIIANRAHL